MLKKCVFLLFSFIVLVTAANAMTVGKVEMEESMAVGDTALLLNGAGIREKFFTNIYVAGLYLKEKNSDFQKIIDMDETMGIKIKITSKLITSDRFKEACEEGFARTTNGNMEPLRSKIDLSYTAFANEIEVGDIFDIIYEKGKGTSYFKNGKKIVEIEGLDFKKALFGIWIIDNPSHKNEKLRQGMLGLP
jgi:hypothetical protein